MLFAKTTYQFSSKSLERPVSLDEDVLVYRVQVVATGSGAALVLDFIGFVR